MSTIKSSAEHLTLNADGSGNDIKFQSNGSEVASISDGGVVTATSFSGSGANLTGISSGPTHTSSGSAPGSPSIGDFWHDTTNDKLYIRTNDGSSNIWLQI